MLENLNKEKLAHIVLFVTAGLLFLVVALADKQRLDVFIKPIVMLSLSYLYVVKAPKINYWVLLSIALVMITEVIVMTDFIKYFRVILILQSIYYLFTIGLLWKSVQNVSFKLRKFFLIQLLSSLLFVGILLYYVTDLVLPSVADNLHYIMVFVCCFMSFTGFCFFIYMNTNSLASFSLMITGCCFLVVNVIEAFNEFYSYILIFAVLPHILQVVGQYFLIKFFAEEDQLLIQEEEEEEEEIDV